MLFRSEEQAVKAAQALAKTTRWQEQADLPDEAALPEFLRAQPTDDEVLSDKTASPVSGAMHRAAYTRPYLAHASIGPSCALAWWHDGLLEVWSHSQAIFPLRAELAKILGREKDSIVVRHAEGAGCYGHNGADDAALDRKSTRLNSSH